MRIYSIALKRYSWVGQMRGYGNPQPVVAYCGILLFMRTDVLLTKLSIIFGGFGIFSWFIASLFHWIEHGIPRINADDWMSDAMVLLLIAIWLKLGALYHKPERNRE